MIVSFYDENFKGLQNNASLAVDDESYSLIKRPVDTDELSCTCEAFTEEIQPAFVVVKDNRGNNNNFVYSAFAGIPVKTTDNKTQVTGTDLISYFSSDLILSVGSYSTVNEYINYLFNEFKIQVNKKFNIELNFKEYVGDIEITDLQPIAEAGSYNFWTELQAMLKYYDLYIESKVDLVNKKIVYTIGKTLFRNMDIKLWEYGVLNVGKWIAPVNEVQGYYDNGAGSYTAGIKWILLSNGNITIDESLRDIYPVKKNIVINTSSIEEANREALEKLLENVYQEDIELKNVEATFETGFNVYVKKGGGLYKRLPCGELRYNINGLESVQLGYRYIGAQFI